MSGDRVLDGEKNTCRMAWRSDNSWGCGMKLDSHPYKAFGRIFPTTPSSLSAWCRAFERSREHMGVVEVILAAVVGLMVDPVIER